MAGAKIHTSLSYYNKTRYMYNEWLPKMNGLISELKDYLSLNCINGEKEWEEINRSLICTIMADTKRIRFWDISRYHMDLAKSCYKINKLEKTVNQYGVKFSTVIDGVTIRFDFNLPGTCKVVTEYEYEEVDSDSYTLESGKLLKKSERHVKVECGNESMIDAIFSEREAAQ